VVVDTPGLDRPLDASLAGADVAVNLHGRGPQSTALLAAASPRRLVAFGGGGGSADGPQWRAEEHEVARWCRLVEAAGVPADPGDLRLAAPAVDPTVTMPGVTVVHPGASVEAKRWPTDRWAAVARSERAAGRPVVVTGSAGEAELARAVAEAAGLGEDAVRAGRTDLVELAALVAGAGRVVSGDTGIAHLASAYATPSVVLFGPVGPARWGPPADGPHVALWAGRSGDPFGTVADPGLLALSVADVLGALDRLPTRASSGSGS